MLVLVYKKGCESCTSQHTSGYISIVTWLVRLYTHVHQQEYTVFEPTKKYGGQQHNKKQTVGPNEMRIGFHDSGDR